MKIERARTPGVCDKMLFSWLLLSALSHAHSASVWSVDSSRVVSVQLAERPLSESPLTSTEATQQRSQPLEEVGVAAQATTVPSSTSTSQPLSDAPPILSDITTGSDLLRPQQFQDALLDDLTSLAGRGSSYVRTHIGVEAAGALLLAVLLSLCALSCIVNAFCGYSLCCFSRGRRRVAKAVPQNMMAPELYQQYS